jgi:hypothetical protein
MQEVLRMRLHRPMLGATAAHMLPISSIMNKTALKKNGSV